LFKFGFIIISIGETAFCFEPQTSLENSASFVPSGFHFFVFENNDSFYRANSSALRPTPSLEG
jgi:hypothetical protein